MEMHLLVLIGAVVAATIIGSFNALLGGVAGVIVTLGVGAWGFMEIQAGRSMAFMGRPIDQTTFLVAIAALTAVNVSQVIRGLRRRKR